MSALEPDAYAARMDAIEDTCQSARIYPDHKGTGYNVHIFDMGGKHIIAVDNHTTGSCLMEDVYLGDAPSREDIRAAVDRVVERVRA